MTAVRIDKETSGNHLIHPVLLLFHIKDRFNFISQCAFSLPRAWFLIERLGNYIG